MSYYSELLEDLSEGLESWFGDCGDQEGDGFLNCACAEGVAKWGLWRGWHTQWSGKCCPWREWGYTDGGGTEVAARDELIELQGILPLCTYTE